MSFLVILDLFIHALGMLTGLIGNSFILVVLFLDWLRTHVHNPCNIILNGIAISNIFLEVAVVIQEFAYFLFFDFYMQEKVTVLFVAIIISLLLSSLWCSTCLCFYYCVKIVQFRGAVFYKMKAKLPLIVPWLLAFSVFLSWSVGIASYWDVYLDFTGNITSTMMPEYKSKCSCIFQVHGIVASVAFTLILLTTGAIITSLCWHMKRMRQSNEGHGHARINTHLSASRTMTSLLIIYLLFYIAFTLLNDPSVPQDETLIAVCINFTALFPFMNSVILILGNRNLMNVLKKLLCRQSSPSGTGVTVSTF